MGQKNKNKWIDSNLGEVLKINASRIKDDTFCGSSHILRNTTALLAKLFFGIFGVRIRDFVSYVKF